MPATRKKAKKSPTDWVGIPTFLMRRKMRDAIEKAKGDESRASWLRRAAQGLLDRQATERG